MKTPLKSSSTNRLATAALVAAGVAIGASGAKLSWNTANATEMWQTQTAPPPAVVRDVNIDALNRAFTSLADHVSPAVVNVYVTTKADAVSPRMRRVPPGMGPGMGQDPFDFFFGNPFDG